MRLRAAFLGLSCCLLLLPSKASAQPTLTGQLFFTASPADYSAISIWAMDLDTRQSRQVIDLTGRFYYVDQLDVSANGRRVAFRVCPTACDTNMEIYVMNADGTDLHPVTNYPSSDHAIFPRWSPSDPDLLYYMRTTDLGHDWIHRVNVVTGVDVEVREGFGEATKGIDITADETRAVMVRESACCWHPNAFTSYQDLNDDNYVVLSPSDGRSQADTRINRQDGWIVYWEEPVGAGTTGVIDLFKMDPQGQNTVNITSSPGPGGVGTPVWAGGDNTGYVIFTTNVLSGTTQVVAMLADLSQWTSGLIPLGTLPFVEVTGPSPVSGSPAWTPYRAIDVSPARLLGGTRGGLYAQQITASGGSPPHRFSVVRKGNLPKGLSLSPDGLLRGRLRQSGESTFDVAVTDSKGSTGTRRYSLQVSEITCPSLAVSPSSLSDGLVGTSYNASLGSTGGTGSYAYTLTSGSLPPGLSLSASGSLSGAPLESGKFKFSVTTTDTMLCSATRRYSLEVLAPTCGTITLAPAILPDGTLGTAYSQNLSASGGTGSFQYGFEGTLPPGLSLDAAGQLSGTPSAAGTFGFRVFTTNQGTCNVSQLQSVNINAPDCLGPIDVSPATFPAAFTLLDYGRSVVASGGTPGYTYAVQDGSLPPGLALKESGELYGFPTAEGTFSFTIAATDTDGCRGSTVYSVPVLFTPFANYFDDGVRDDLWSYQAGSWTEKGGKLVSAPSRSPRTALAPAFNSCNPTCAIETKIGMGTGSGNEVSLLGWYQDPDNYVALILQQDTGRWVLEQHVGGVVAQGVKVPRPILSGGSYTVRVVFDGADFAVFADGEVTPLITMAAAATPSGRAGFRAVGAGATFDRLTVE